MHYKKYDIVNCKQYEQYLKAYKPMQLQRLKLRNYDVSKIIQVLFIIIKRGGRFKYYLILK